MALHVPDALGTGRSCFLASVVNAVGVMMKMIVSWYNADCQLVQCSDIYGKAMLMAHTGAVSLADNKQ